MSTEFADLYSRPLTWSVKAHNARCIDVRKARLSSTGDDLVKPFGDAIDQLHLATFLTLRLAASAGAVGRGLLRLHSPFHMPRLL
jgi:hypothetical protein